MEPIRVLHEDVILNPGGIEALLMNLYRHIDREQLQFDFMVHRPDKGLYEDEVTSMGGKIYRTPPFNPFKIHSFRSSVCEILEAHPEYKVFHCHAELNLWPLKYAHKLGIPTRIAHSHNAKTVVNLKYFFFLYEKMFIKKHCTDMFMCSTPAGEWSYGKKAVADGKVKFIKNGVETEKFRFNEQVRADVRRELNITDEILIGHVGRFMQQKNHGFLIDIFNEIHKKNPKTVLVMVGEGQLREENEKKVSQLGLQDCVRFLGVRNDVNRLYQAFDLFLFPSLWEGLPLTGVEAQASGLPVLMSDVITPEVYIVPHLHTKSLKNSAGEWADEALSLVNSYKRRDCIREIRDAGFDIQETADWLQNFYIERTLRARSEQKN